MCKRGRRRVEPASGIRRDGLKLLLRLSLLSDPGEIDAESLRAGRIVGIITVRRITLTVVINIRTLYALRNSNEQSATVGSNIRSS